MAGADDAGTGAIGADGVELTLRLGSPAAAPPPVGNIRNLTMVYGRRGVLCTVDVAELQARAIISMANREITGQVQRDRDGGVAQAQLDLAMAPATASPSLRDQAAGLSMKRSLQRFLEKRKARVDDAGAPYAAHHRPAQPPGT